MIIAGIDEAGYGPLLGPLVVSATAFEVGGGTGIQSMGGVGELPLEPEELPCIWRLLKSAVAKKSTLRKGRLLITDSKVVHNLADGNKLLERGVLAFLRSLPALPGAEGSARADWQEFTVAALLEVLGCTNHELPAHPWYGSSDMRLPWLADAGDLGIASNVLAGVLDAAKVRTVCMRTAVVSERAFNRMVGGTQNKASALVSITMAHLHHLHTHFGNQGLVVGVDKQGGRDHYTTLLLRCFPQAELKVLEESAEGSSYLLQEPAGPGEGTLARRTLIHFREKGEMAFFPTALASMTCKYLRELCMHSFNAWWCSQVAGLRPTAGYYQDGSRWLIDVEPHLARLGVQREMLVRVR